MLHHFSRFISNALFDFSFSGLRIWNSVKLWEETIDLAALIIVIFLCKILVCRSWTQNYMGLSRTIFYLLRTICKSTTSLNNFDSSTAAPWLSSSCTSMYGFFSLKLDFFISSSFLNGYLRDDWFTKGGGNEYPRDLNMCLCVSALGFF